MLHGHHSCFQSVEPGRLTAQRRRLQGVCSSWICKVLLLLKLTRNDLLDRYMHENEHISKKHYWNEFQPAIITWILLKSLHKFMLNIVDYFTKISLIHFGWKSCILASIMIASALSIKSLLTNSIWIYCHEYIEAKYMTIKKSEKRKREHANVILRVHSRITGYTVMKWQNINVQYAAIYTTRKLATRPGPNRELLLKTFLKIGSVPCAARPRICLRKWIKRIYLR